MSVPDSIDKLTAVEIGEEVRRIFILLGRDIEVEIDEQEIRVRVTPRSADHFRLPDGPLRVTVYKRGVSDIEPIKRITDA